MLAFSNSGPKHLHAMQPSPAILTQPAGSPPPARSLAVGLAIATALSAIVGPRAWAENTADHRGAQFMGFSRFAGFARSRGAHVKELVLTSPTLVARQPFDEMVASWNADAPPATFLKVEVRALYLEGPSRYYVLGLWSPTPERYPRQSVAEQQDDQGDVLTDTLKLKRPAERFQVRVTLGGDNLLRPELKFLGLSLVNSHAPASPLPPNRAAWGKSLPVPERSQMAYPDGKTLCSPAALSMVLGYWADHLQRPELDRPIPEIAQAVYDSQWKGAGNWPFNTAYAGGFRGLRAYVTRLTDIAELESWTAAGVPVCVSLCYDRLRGKGPGPNGHLMVCVGFTASGDPILNDPGTSKDIRRVFPRANLENAWTHSRNTVYLVYPVDWEIPKDRFAHWDSWTARQRIVKEQPLLP
jgi:hypothetical protein